MNGFSITQEALLATEELITKQNKAEGSTPQAYDRFTEQSEQEAIKDREESAEEETDLDTGVTPEGQEEQGEQTPEDQTMESDGTASETPPPSDGESTTDTQAESGEDAEGSDALADSIDSPAEPTMEAVSDWIRDKTQYSDSAIVRNAGALAAGLAHLGITYGPSILNYMFKGMLWTFSRLGTVLYDGSKALSAYRERSKTSVSKLEARLSAVEKQIVNGLNTGNQVPEFVYKNQKAIAFLKVGDNLDFTSNLRIFASSISKTSNGLASEFESGLAIIERIAQSGSEKKLSHIRPMMEVQPPRTGFSKGSLPGYQSEPDLVEQYRTDPIWPGDAALIFNCPVIKSDDMSEITAAYGKADMFVGLNKESSGGVSSMKSYSGPQLVTMAKSIRILLAAMNELDKSQARMQDLRPKFALKAKQLFMNLADDKAKAKMRDSMVEPMYLRSALATTVFVNGSISTMTHASRVAASAVAFLEAHGSKIATSTE